MAVKGKKKRQKRKPIKQMGKITTGLWEQSFLIASLPQFVDARLSEFDTLGGGPQMRIGEWIGISGDMSHIMGLLANAQNKQTNTHSKTQRNQQKTRLKQYQIFHLIQLK